MDKKIVDKEIERQQTKLNPLNEDFYSNLPITIRSVLDSLKWQYQDRPWFNKAWEEYRSEVLKAGLNGKYKMPKEIFGPYVAEEIKKYYETAEKASGETQAIHAGLDSEEDADVFLEHHGIKGQKWGVRRFQNEDGTLTEEGKKRYKEDSQKVADMSTAIAELEDLTRQYNLRNTNNTKILVPKEDKKLWQDAYKLFRDLEKKYEKDKISTKIKTLEDGTDYVVSSVYDKKLGGTVEYYEPLSYDSNGKKYNDKNRLYTKNVEHSDELEHHGIKGQKWGVRRFQNEDGTLTPAGKVRYNEDLTKKDVNTMTDEELRRANNRIAAEQQFQNLTGTSQPSRALTKDNAIKIGATFIATGAMTFLLRKWRKNSWLEQGATKKARLGKSVAEAAVAGGIGALIVGARTFGGETNVPSKKEKKD